MERKSEECGVVTVGAALRCLVPTSTVAPNDQHGIMVGLLYPLALLWAIIYAAEKRRQRKSNRLSLPVYAVSRTQAAKCQVKLRPLYLTIETTLFNQAHDKFAWYLLRNRPLKNILRYFYGFGAVLGLVGMFGGIGTLMWTTWKLSKLLLSAAHTGDGPVKRDAIIPPSHGDGLPFHPIVGLSFSLMVKHDWNHTDTRCHHSSW